MERFQRKILTLEPHYILPSLPPRSSIETKSNLSTIDLIHWFNSKLKGGNSVYSKREWKISHFLPQHPFYNEKLTPRHKMEDFIWKTNGIDDKRNPTHSSSYQRRLKKIHFESIWLENNLNQQGKEFRGGKTLYIHAVDGIHTHIHTFGKMELEKARFCRRKAWKMENSDNLIENTERNWRETGEGKKIQPENGGSCE